MKNKKIFVLFFVLIILLSTGCTKQLKRADGSSASNPNTGQVLPSNILCAPTDKENIEIYNETRKELLEKYAKELENDDITKKEYDKKVNNLLNIDELVSCEKFTPASDGYEGLWNTIFVKTLSWLLIKIGSILKNYGLSIIVTTLLIRLVLYPVTVKSAKQSENIKKATPELKKIEEKYKGKNDQESMMKKSQETMIVYKKYNINPLSGCLFALIQIPLFLAFYEALNRLPILFEDKLIFNMATTPLNGLGKGHYAYIILVILVALSTYFSFKLNKGANMSGDQEKQMNRMMLFMMIMIVVMSFKMSTAIIYYWITNSTFTIIQNLLVKRSK